MTPFFTVVETQIAADGGTSVLAQCFGSESEAQSNYFTRCASASISGLPYHAVYLIDSRFGAIKQETWDRREVD